MIDFSLTPELAALEARTESFIRDVVIPCERDPREGAHGLDDSLKRELMAKAKDAGLLSPHVGEEWGGLGLDTRSMAVVFEAAGYSLLGPHALNCAAPDEGNMHLLEVVANDDQKEQWLRPLAAGEIRSCFSMTEPDGAGSDPTMLATTARQDGNHWVISGPEVVHHRLRGGESSTSSWPARPIASSAVTGRRCSWWTTTIPPSRRSAVRRPWNRASPAGTTRSGSTTCGSARTRCSARSARATGTPRCGWRRPRLTHCMRWLGAAKRAHDIACGYAVRREAFGKPLAEHEGVGFMLADNALDMHLARLVIWQAAWVLDEGGEARQESSMAKVFCSEAEFRVIDRCMQILGGIGITTDTLVERLWREIRPFRIYDGPNEVHRWAIAKRIAKAARSRG